jgi:hypothetical protein
MAALRSACVRRTRRSLTSAAIPTAHTFPVALDLQAQHIFWLPERKDTF